MSALRDAVEELGHLEEYVRAMKPSKEDAIGLAVRSLHYEYLPLHVSDLLCLLSAIHLRHP